MVTEHINIPVNAVIKRLTREQTAKRMGWSVSTLRDRLKDKNYGFIQPTMEGKRPYWLSTDVDAYILNFFNKTNRLI